MNTLLMMRNIIKTISIGFLFLISTAEMISQERNHNQLREFSITISKSYKGEVKLKCTEGCAWKKLTYKQGENVKPQAIDEFGMTKLKASKTSEDENLADFLFTIEIKKSTVSLKGVDGTAWRDLSFSISPEEEQKLNQNGMMD